MLEDSSVQCLYVDDDDLARPGWDDDDAFVEPVRAFSVKEATNEMVELDATSLQNAMNETTQTNETPSSVGVVEGQRPASVRKDATVAFPKVKRNLQKLSTKDGLESRRLLAAYAESKNRPTWRLSILDHLARGHLGLRELSNQLQILVRTILSHP
jgi:hypothetical protein